MSAAGPNRIFHRCRVKSSIVPTKRIVVDSQGIDVGKQRENTWANGVFKAQCTVLYSVLGTLCLASLARGSEDTRQQLFDRPSAALGRVRGAGRPGVSGAGTCPRSAA